MARRKSIPLFLCAGLAATLGIACGQSQDAGQTNIASQVLLLQQQNEALQSQLQKQQHLIEVLSGEVGEIRTAAERSRDDLDRLKNDAPADEAGRSESGFSLGKVQLTGEGGAAFFESGSRGTSPNAEFRVDEARLFVDAAVWGNVYAYAELDLAERESDDLELYLGELYLDWEDVSELWGRDGELNLRAGRLYIPFGEEYLERYAIRNPFISHSLSDLWGVDEGIELYGAVEQFSYAVAVQNGGIGTRDFTADKSVAGRISYDPKPWLHFSVSGMRTGDMSVQDEGLSEIWFGNGWFRSLGSAQTTRFHADLAEADVEARLPRGHVKAFGGYIRYGDNDPAANNGRDVFYYSVEAVQDLAGKLYAGARFSQIVAAHGFPIVGNGSMDDYLFGPLTDNLWRLTLGMGYRWNRHLLVKAEYTLEQGKEAGGRRRNHEDLFATEAAFGF